MAERSVKCPTCPFQFASLVDAGNYHAYLCPDCGWERPTTDRRSANRPADVCSLCDTPISLRGTAADHHLYVGSGWVHGGGREYIPVHISCMHASTYPEGCPAQEIAAARVRERLVAA